jgi:hypothetical protein
MSPFCKAKKETPSPSEPTATCIGCGQENQEAEEDARAQQCTACNQYAVYGADEIKHGEF